MYTLEPGDVVYQDPSNRRTMVRRQDGEMISVEVVVKTHRGSEIKMWMDVHVKVAAFRWRE